MWEHGGDLERSHQPEPRDPRRRQRRDVTPLVHDTSPGRIHEFGQEIEAGGLAGAVRADQRVNRAAGNAQVDAVDRNEPGKFLGEILGLEDEIVAHEAPALLVDRSVSTFATRSAKRPASVANRKIKKWARQYRCAPKAPDGTPSPLGCARSCALPEAFPHSYV